MAKNELTLEELAKQIYQGAGGMGNVESIVHCMTRVRMKVINDDLVNVSELKAIPGVLGVVEDEQLQVIIGPGKVNKVAQDMVDLAGVKLGESKFFCIWKRPCKRTGTRNESGTKIETKTL